MIVLVTLVILAVSVPFLWVGWSAWSGRRRRWAVDFPEAGALHRLNYLPLKAGLAGLWILSFLPGAIARVAGWEAAEMIEFFTVLPAGLVLIVAKLWWPSSVVPQWHKDWVARGGDVGALDVPLWSGRGSR